MNTSKFSIILNLFFNYELKANGATLMVNPICNLIVTNLVTTSISVTTITPRAAAAAAATTCRHSSCGH
tara:strand:+ start:493 stop:699 length:207 start_codon:yes stop_codon:yes gene_type:complete